MAFAIKMLQFKSRSENSGTYVYVRVATVRQYRHRTLVQASQIGMRRKFLVRWYVIKKVEDKSESNESNLESSKSETCWARAHFF